MSKLSAVVVPAFVDQLRNRSVFWSLAYLQRSTFRRRLVQPQLYEESACFSIVRLVSSSLLFHKFMRQNFILNEQHI